MSDDCARRSKQDDPERQALLLTTLRSIGDAVIVTDETGRITLMNPEAERMTGWREAEAAGKPCEEVFRIANETTGALVESPIDKVLRTGVVVGLANHTVLTARDGTVYPIDDSAAPIRGADGTLQGIVLVFRNISERKKEEAARQFLIEASTLLASSLDYEETLQQVAGLAVPRIGDWCSVDMLEDEGAIRQLAVAHVDPEKVQWARELRKLYPPNPDEPTGVPHVLRTGQAEMYTDIPDALLVAAAHDEHHLEVMRRIGFRAVIIVPITARERVLGAVTLVTTAESGRSYGSDDLALAEGLAARAGLAIDNARLYRIAQKEIVERNRAEDALRVSEERFRFALANSDITVYLMDGDLRYTWAYSGRVSGELTDIYGRTDAEIVAPDEAEFLTEIKRRVLATGVEERHIARASRPGRGSGFYDTLFMASRDAEGNVTGLTGTVTDVTERLRTQESLARHQAEVEALNTRLQRSMRETHHRVKNSLQVITALIDMLQTQYAEAIPAAELTRLTQHIQSLASIHDLLTQQARTDAEVSTISVLAILEKLLPTLRSMAAERAITFTIEDLSLPVRQSTTVAVLVNELISNALKHGRGDIHVGLHVLGPNAILEVLDAGPGFPPDFNSTNAANTGLDLIGSLAQIDLGGSVRYENRAEGGARVAIEFGAEQI